MILYEMKISVITPAFNPRADYLKRTFDGLNGQRLPKQDWEYIVVDNNSSPSLESLVDLSWHSNARVVVEPKQGLTPARLRGFAEAKADLVVMVDDDCVLDPAYLETALRLMKERPYVGVMGALLTGEYEEPPEPWVKKFSWLLCDFRNHERQIPLQYALTRKSGPWSPVGAGMVIRRTVIEEYIRQVNVNAGRGALDRTGRELMGSGDSDIAYTAIDLGLAVGTSNDLRIAHLIPKERTTLHNMKRLLYGSNYAAVALLIARGWLAPVEPENPGWVSRLREKVGRLQRKTPLHQCRAAFNQGYIDGRSKKSFDPQYR